MIPANIDYQAIVRELNSWGILDYKIEQICGLAQASVAHIKEDSYRDMTYQRAARLYNFWCEERQMRGLQVFAPVGPHLFEKNQHLTATT